MKTISETILTYVLILVTRNEGKLQYVEDKKKEKKKPYRDLTFEPHTPFKHLSQVYTEEKQWCFLLSRILSRSKPNLIPFKLLLADTLDWMQALHGIWAPSSAPLRVRAAQSRSWKVRCTQARRWCRVVNSSMDAPERLKLNQDFKKMWGTYLFKNQ